MPPRSSSTLTPRAASKPRHPSAGNLGDRPLRPGNDDATGGVSTLGYPAGAPFGASRVRLGPGLDDESLDRLVGNVDGKRILELGCGDGSNAIALARGGARVIVVEPSATRLAAARRAAEAHEVRVEFHHSDLADLAFVRGDQIDLCLAVYSLSEVGDVSRVFRQVHRVLRTEAPMLISLPHPLEIMCEKDPADDGARLKRSAFDDTLVAVEVDEGTMSVYPHRITDMFTTLGRSNFRVDTLLEPKMTSTAATPFDTRLHSWCPATVIYRARKQGI